MDTSTRYIGFCAVCQSRIKVRDGLLVHHGYKRPGDGAIHGDCFGVKMPPHELSDRTAREYLHVAVEPEVERALAAVNFLGEEPYDPPYLYFEATVDGFRYGRPLRDRYGNSVLEKKTKAEVERYDWGQKLSGERYRAQQRLKFWLDEKKRLVTLIETWRLEPLETVEEEVAKQEQTRAARTAQLTAEREQKMAEALVSLQKRIDSAVKNHKLRTLRELFEDGYRKLNSISRPTLNRQEILRLVDRDHVWNAFGLIRGGAYVEQSVVFEALRPWDPWGDNAADPAPWPAVLGGGKVKS